MKQFLFLIFLLFAVLATFAKDKVIAISYFDNTTSNSKYNALSKGIADMLITDLSKAKGVEIVEREKLEELLKEIKLGKSSYFDQSTAQKLGKGLGASTILTGAFYVLNDVIRIDARLINVENGKIMIAEEVTGNTSDFFGLHKQLVKLLIESLNVNFNPKTESTVDYDNKIELTAVVNYSNAISYEDNGLEENATVVLENTIKKYPEFLFAKTKLDKIKEFIAERERERAALMNVKLADFWKDFNPGSDSTALKATPIFNSFLMNQDYTSLLIFNQKLRKKGIKEDRPAYTGSEVTIGELMNYYDCIALYTLKKYDKLITPSKLFLSKYPTSMYFNSVKMFLNMGIKELEKIEEGKKGLSEALEYNEKKEYLDFLNQLDYYMYSRFIQKDMYKKFKKIYEQQIINSDKGALLLFEPYDRFDDITEFFDIAEENGDKELMIQIKDLAIAICENTDYEEQAYDLEEDIERYEEKKERHLIKKAEALEKLTSGDINQVSSAITWFWLMRDKKEENFIIDWSEKYLLMNDNREQDKVYSTRLKAYENIVEALDRLGEFDKMKTTLERYNSDEILLKNKDREYATQGREFKKHLREGPKQFQEFVTKILNHDIKSNILAGQAKVYKERYQYVDEINIRKELLNKYDLSDSEKESQYYNLYFAYFNVGNFALARKNLELIINEFPNGVYSDASKSIISTLPK